MTSVVLPRQLVNGVRELRFVVAKKQESAAVCGSALGGLSCAGCLIQAGHDVTIF